MKTISITKREFRLIRSSLRRSEINLEKEQKKEYAKLVDKFYKLSPYYDYVLDPIQYDEF